MDSQSGHCDSDGTPSLEEDCDSLPDVEPVNASENGYALEDSYFGSANPAFPGHTGADAEQLEFGDFQARLNIIKAVADGPAGGVAISPLQLWVAGRSDHWTPFHLNERGVKS